MCPRPLTFLKVLLLPSSRPALLSPPPSPPARPCTFRHVVRQRHAQKGGGGGGVGSGRVGS
eukprot:11994518-Prorocentrum_lima.AAC.1